LGVKQEVNSHCRNAEKHRELEIPLQNWRFHQLEDLLVDIGGPDFSLPPITNSPLLNAFALHTRPFRDRLKHQGNEMSFLAEMGNAGDRGYAILEWMEHVFTYSQFLAIARGEPVADGGAVQAVDG
jgi:hypothetical protein